MSRYGDRGSREEFTIEDIARGRTIMASDLDKSFEQVFMCNKAHGDALVRAFRNKKYPRRILVHGDMIVSVKIDYRGFVVHKWTKKIIDLKQVYLVVKDAEDLPARARVSAAPRGEEGVLRRPAVRPRDEPPIHAAHLLATQGTPARRPRRRRRSLLREVLGQVRAREVRERRRPRRRRPDDDAG